MKNNSSESSNQTTNQAIASPEQNARLEHSRSGTTTRDATDLGVPMLPGNPKTRALPEDALSDQPTRGDYSQRLGESNYSPHEVRSVEDAKTGKPTVVVQSQSEFNRQIETEKTNSPVEAAKAKLEEIREKLTDGDLTEAEFKRAKADFQEATTDLEFAELREQAKIDRDRRQFETDRRERLSSLQTDLAGLSDTSHLEKMLPKITDSIERYISAVAERNQKLAEIRDELSAGGFLVGTTPGPIEGVPAIVERGEIIIGTATAKNVEPRPALEKALNESLRKFFPRG